MCKVCRVGQGHLEIGLYEWQQIIERHVTNRQPAVKFFSQLTGAELDAIIAEMEAVKQSKIVPPPSAITVQATFW